MPAFWSRLVLVCGLLFVTLPARAQAYTPPAIAGHVTDAAGKLGPQEVAKLDAKLAEYRRCSSNHVAVFVARSLEGHTVEDVAYATFNAWKVGEAGKDNGVLLVIAPAERKVRIETGKGVGGNLTDVQSSEIIRQRVSPRLAAGDFFGAIDGGTTAIELALGGCGAAPGAGPARAAGKQGYGSRQFPVVAGVALVALALLFVLRVRMPFFVALFALAFGGPICIIPYEFLGPPVIYGWAAVLAVVNLLVWRKQRLHGREALTFSKVSAAGAGGAGSSYGSSGSGWSGSSGGSGYSGGGGSSGGGGASGSY
jgi:uncharacterized protein